MSHTIPLTSKVNHLEQTLSGQKNPLQRLLLIDQLIQYFSFTNISKAQQLLREQHEILIEHPHPDYQLNFHLYTAFVENQLYHFPDAEFHYLLSIDLLQERGTLVQQAEVFIDYAGVAMNLGHNENAEHYIQKAEKVLNIYPDERLLARLVCREGFLNLHFGDFSNAIELLLKADKKINALKDPLKLKDYYFLTLIHSGLGKVYEQNDDLEQSIYSYRKVVRMCEEMGMGTRLAWHYLNVGTAYMSQNNREEAEHYFLKAIDTSDDLSEFARASAYANLGYCQYEEKNYEKALNLFDRAEGLFKQNSASDYYNFSIIEGWRGRLHADLGDKDEALIHFTKALKNAHKSGNNKQLSGICKDMATFFAEIKRYKKAYEYQIQYDKYQEIYSEEINRRRQLEFEVKYEAEKRKQEADMLQLQAIKLQLKALRAQMNPHFMYNALNSIQNFITSNHAESASKYLAKFAKLMRQSLDYSDLENISLEKEIEFLDNYLEINQKLRFEDRLTYEIIIDEEIEEDILGVPTMIIQPYVENAIEHGLRTKQQGHIKIIFALYDEDGIMCIVEDNGIGRKKARMLKLQDPKFQNHRSRGTAITEERLRILHQSEPNEVFVEIVDLIDAETSIPTGTQVKIKIPIVEIKIK